VGNSAPWLLGLPRYYRAHVPAATAYTACTDTVFTETVRQQQRQPLRQRIYGNGYGMLEIRH